MKNRDGMRASDRQRFATTRWSVVLAAGKSTCVQQQKALEMLCQSYWYPLYAYIRRRGYDSHQAEDLAQGFVAHLLEKQDLQTADPKYGKFRSFLLIRLKSFLGDERHRANARKRGGGRKILSLSYPNAEGQYALEPADQLSPDKLFEKSWALTVLERTLDQLEADMVNKGNQRLFEHLKVYLTTEGEAIPYKDMAIELDITEGAIRVAVHRLRRQYRRLLLDEVAQTIGHEDQIDEEMGCLFAALAR